MHLGARLNSGLVLLLSVGTLAHSPSPPAVSGTRHPTAVPDAIARKEIARGAAAIAAITDRKYPYETAYRLLRACLEKNVQHHRDSDAFLVGAHLVIASWVEDLPEDVRWRERALARHRDIAEWLRPHVNLSS